MKLPKPRKRGETYTITVSYQNIYQGIARVEHANISKVRRSYWLGPHCLFDGPTPYSHHYFPYVPFWGAREDNTNIPYGFVRRMKFSQDSINSGISKLRWGMLV